MVDTVRSTPTDERITHDLVLSDGVSELGLIVCNSRGVPINSGTPWSLRQSGSQRTSLQIRTGDPTYSDYQLPYTPFTQKDWSGGRGSEDFEKDTTRFYDSNRMDTRMGDMLLGPKETTVLFSDSTSSIEPVADGASNVNIVTGGKRYASSYTTTDAVNFSSIIVRVAPGQNVTVEIIKDAAGVPSADGGDLVASSSSSVPALDSTTSTYGPAFGESPFGWDALGLGVFVTNAKETVLAEVPIEGTLAASTKYWIVITSTAIGYAPLTGGAVYKEDGSWSSVYSNNNVYFKLLTFINGSVMFFNYKGALYALTNDDSGEKSQLFINGYRGTAQTGSTQNKIVVPAGMGLTAGELAGCVLQVIAGKCYNETPNYRVIKNNTTTEIELKEGFLKTPNTTTDFVILGCNKWNKITGTGITKKVTSVCVSKGKVCFAQGESTYIRKMREYNNSGTWTRAFEDDGTNVGTFLLTLPNHNGQSRVWKFNNPVDSPPTASYATPVAWAGTHDFATKPTEISSVTVYPIEIGDEQSKITNVLGYGDPILPWVIKEDEFGNINKGIYATVPISELRHVKSELNGVAAIQFGVYLFISVLEGLERYYENRLDDVGPNRDEGFPTNRRGNISAITSYPGGLFLAIDAGNDGYSSVLYWNQIGYHEFYRAPLGNRIRGLHVQPIPGGQSARLWIGMADKTVWIPICINPRQQADYRYTATGSLESAWFNGGFREISKFWKSLQIYAEHLSAGQTISAEYMTDADNVWYALPDTFDSSPMQEVLMATDYSVYGKRWKYRLTLTTDDDTISPRVKAVTVPAVTRLPPNKAWSMTVLADDALVDRQGVRQRMTAKELMDILDAWSDSGQSPIPLTMRSPIAAFDNQRVFIEPPTIQPIEVQNGAKKSLKAIVSLNIYAA
jgi:hypothetical protein